MTQTSQTPANILVVDDDPACRKLLQMALGKASIGCAKIEVAESIEQTVDRLQAERFDVILLDLNLPGSYGGRTMQTVAEAQPTAAIIIVSGLDKNDLDMQEMPEQVRGCLSKGRFDVKTLEKTIAQAIG